MDSGQALGLLGLARKAGKLALGEEEAAAAALGHKAKLILLAADAAENTAQRVRRAAETGNAPCVRTGFTKAQMGAAVGRASCAAAAFTDVGMAAAAAKRLAGGDPEVWDETAQRLEAKAAKTLRRRREKRSRQGAAKAAKPWAPPPNKDSER